MSKKGENIYKRKDGRWEGRYIKSRTLSGKAIYGYVYAKTYRETKTKLANTQILLANNVDKITKDKDFKSFEETAIRWFEVIKPHIKESTCNKYQNLMESYIFPVFGEISISNITHNMLETHCNELLKTGGIKNIGLSSKTISDILSVVHGIMQYALKNGIQVVCDTHLIKIKHQTSEMRILSRNEQNQLCQYLYSDLSSYNIGILVCLFTGLRIGEICALRWEDISFSEQTIRVHQTLQRIQDRSNGSSKTKIIITTPKSSCSIRTIPIPDNLIKLMKNYQTSKTGYFLTNSNEKYLEPRNMQYHFKIALKKSSVALVNYHTLRHTFATRCIELGFDVKSLSEILGHSNVNITMNRYVHPSMELKNENMQRLSKLLAVK